MSNAKRQIKKGKNNVGQIEWQTYSGFGAIQTYKDLGLITITQIKSLSELTMKFEVMGWVIVARSGPRYFAAYHKRFQLEERTDTHCVRG